MVQRRPRRLFIMGQTTKYAGSSTAPDRTKFTNRSPTSSVLEYHIGDATISQGAKRKDVLRDREGGSTDPRTL